MSCRYTPSTASPSVPPGRGPRTRFPAHVAHLDDQFGVVLPAGLRIAQRHGGSPRAPRRCPPRGRPPMAAARRRRRLPTPRFPRPACASRPRATAHAPWPGPAGSAHQSVRIRPTAPASSRAAAARACTDGRACQPGPPISSPARKSVVTSPAAKAGWRRQRERRPRLVRTPSSAVRSQARAGRLVLSSRVSPQAMSLATIES